jgi:hypothetical protein
MADKTSSVNKSKAWHAVAIRPKGGSCEAVQGCRMARFLSSQAPRLPLEQCSTADTCTCVYKHHADRRGQPRRQEERDGMRRTSKVTQERRQTRDRRSTD